MTRSCLDHVASFGLFQVGGGKSGENLAAQLGHRSAQRSLAGFEQDKESPDQAGLAVLHQAKY